MTLHRPLLLLFVIVTAWSAADDTWPTVVMRVAGLCYPERASDLKTEIAERSEVRLVSVDYDHAEATFAYDPKRTKPDDLKHLGGAHGFQIHPRCEIPFDHLAKVDIPVAGLDCKGCSLGTANVINRIEGVYLVTVDYKAGVVSTRIDLAKTNREALIDALKKGNVTVRSEPSEAEKK